MTAKLCPDEDFMRLFGERGAKALAEMLGTCESGIYKRRRRLEKRLGVELSPPCGSEQRYQNKIYTPTYPSRVPFRIDDGVILVGSDAHLWPGYKPTAWRALEKFAEDFEDELKMLCLNGDIFDGPTASRHAQIMWENKPNVADEIEFVTECIDSLRSKMNPSAVRSWNIGNHDARFETLLSGKAPEMAGVRGTRLSDQFPHWNFAWSVWVNDELVIKHRFKGGIHATHNNTLWSGKSMTTGHLHSLKVTPFDDYHGTRYGSDSGTLNDPYGPHTAYTEDNPLNHRSGFVVHTFAGGKMLMPEICAVVDENTVQFRGKLIKV
jgi:hypothetical protein